MNTRIRDCRARGRAPWIVGVVLGVIALGIAPAFADSGGVDLRDTSRLRIGIGDRMGIERQGKWIGTLSEVDRLGLRIDLLQMWLPRGWNADWIDRKQLTAMVARGITPVVIHYFFGDAISKERVESQRSEWRASLRKMAKILRLDAPVLVILEPEFNSAPPAGETAITSWPGFAEELRAAAELIRELAPNVLVGTCPGDFSGTPNLEPVLGPVADDLDFLAFQEMRAASDPDVHRTGYLSVGQAAVDYAGYLKRAFGRPILLGYVAVSSYGGWEEPQQDVLRDLVAHRRALREAGVWGAIYFQLYDDPKHRGYFGTAERYFGLLSHDGRAKPALDAFRALTR